MIGELNYNYYGIPDGSKFVNQNSQEIGDFVPMNIWGYYYGNSTNWGKPLDDSVYLWHLDPSAGYATNASFSIATGNTLNIDIAYNQSGTPVPLAMAASDVSGVYADYFKGFYTDPRNRLAYDDSSAGGYAHSALFYNIVFNAFCATPRLAVYKTDGSDGFLGATLDTLATIINASPSTRFLSYFRYDLYSGSNSERVISEYFNESTFRTIAMPDILSDRPIPESCTVVRDAVADRAGSHDPEWVDDRVYSPFSAALGRDWSLSYTESSDNQYRVGFTQQYTPSQLRNGRGEFNGNRLTGQFFKYNPTEHFFSDVSYKWEIVIFDYTERVFLQPGYDITNLSHNIRFMTRLKITDMKDAATIGEATVRAVKHEMAFLGFYFSDSIALAQTGILGSSGNGIGIYLPEKIGGVTTGNYFTGDEIKDVPYADATDTSQFAYSGADPAADTVSHFPNEVMAIPRFGTNYLCHIINVEDINNHLKLIEWGQDALDELFFGQNPYDFIIDITGFPMVEYPEPYDELHPENISLGKLDLQTIPDAPTYNCYGWKIMGGILNYTNPFGELHVPTKYSKSPYNMAFLDYEPYTSLYLYIPYCGMVSIPTDVFMDKTISIRMSVDTMSGDCICYVCVNGVEYLTATGNVATKIPVSGVDLDAYNKAQHDLGMAAVNSIIGGAIKVYGNESGSSISAALKNPTGEMLQQSMGVLNVAQSVIAFNDCSFVSNKTAPSPVQISNGRASIGTGNIQDAVLYVIRPILPDEFDVKSFRKIMGKATYATGKLGDFSGFVQMVNPILDDMPCTAEEKQLIIDALAEGVIL